MALASKSDRSATADAPAAGEQLSDRSRQIIAAAYELLAEAGLEGLTIRAVLKKTGLSRRAFYERFSGKDDLVLAVFEQTIRSAARHYSAQVEGVADPMERLKVIVISIVLGETTMHEAEVEANYRRGAALSREHLRLAESRPEDLQSALQPLITMLAGQLADGMRAGVVRDYAPERLATLVYNLLSTTVQTELLTRARPDQGRRGQLAVEIWDFCRRAIAA